MREQDLHARQQDRRPVVEDRYTLDQWRGQEDRYQREDRDRNRPRDIESTRPLLQPLLALQPRQPIRRSEDTDQDRGERPGRSRLGSKRSFSREREEAEEPPPRSRRF